MAKQILVQKFSLSKAADIQLETLLEKKNSFITDIFHGYFVWNTFKWLPPYQTT